MPCLTCKFYDHTHADDQYGLCMWEPKKSPRGHVVQMIKVSAHDGADCPVYKSSGRPEPAPLIDFIENQKPTNHI